MAQKIVTPVWKDPSVQLRQLASVLQTREGKIAAGAIGVSTAAYLLRQFYVNYKAWRALGPAGAPPNPLGWSVVWILRVMLSRETKSTNVYEEPWSDTYARSLSEKEAEANRTSFLPEDGLPLRSGDRPVMAKFVVPHREQFPVRDMTLKQLQTNILGYLHREYPDTTVLGPSKLEAGSPALFISDFVPVHGTARKHRREICHGHLRADTPDRSSHCTLSYRDAKEVIEKGWGERHPLAGSPIMGTNYILIYAPRNEEELEILRTILKASIEFMVSLA